MARHLTWATIRQVTELLGIATGYHLVKLVGNLIDGEEGVIEQRVGQLLARHVLRHLKMDLEVHGAEKVQGLERYAVASTHGSHLDWAVLLGHFPSPVRFIAKKELAGAPVIGNYLRLRGVLIDRKKGIDARRAIRNALADGQPWPILIFPEGTRSRDGTVGKFRVGGLKLLGEARLPVVPVAITGTFRALPRGSAMVRTGRRLRMVIGDPLRSGDFPSVEAWMGELERRLRAMHAEASKGLPED
jgi:1-acyl-sn-glycerol-3-phosphate acyltransferase